MNPLIISAVTGYNFNQIELFIHSALQNTSCDIALIAQQSDHQTRNALSNVARIKIFTVEDLTDPKDMAQDRFLLARQILNKIQPNKVFLTDSRDVFFQGDPLWVTEAQSNKAIIASEPVKIKNCKINSGWLNSYFGNTVLEKIEENDVLCVGTLGGPVDSIDQLLESLINIIRNKQIALKGRPWGLDQASLNSLIYLEDNDPKKYTIENNKYGSWLTLYHENHISINKRGQITNHEGEKANVIHQYDRFPWLEKHLRSQLLGLQSRI